MSMRLPLAAAAAVGSLGLAAAAHAGVTFTSYADGAQIEPPPPGETLVTDFSDGTFGSAYTTVFPGGSFAGSTAPVVQGTGAFTSGPLNGDGYAAPATGATTLDTGNYIAVEPNTTLTFTSTHSISDISIYAGSLDSYNGVTITGSGIGMPSITYTGSDILGSLADGDRTSGLDNGRLTFTFAPGITTINFTSTSPAFEIASLATSVPEPASWAMMLVGLAGLGGMARSRRSVVAQAV